MILTCALITLAVAYILILVFITIVALHFIDILQLLLDACDPLRPDNDSI